MSLRCDDCAAPCCRAYTIFLTGLDAYRIGRTLHVPLAEFLNLELCTEPDARYRIALGATGDFRYRLHLLKVPDAHPRFESRCTFLVTAGSQGRCGIYGVRPSTCATYPTQIHHGLVGLGGGGDFCPPNSWQIESLDLPTFRTWHWRHDRDQLVYDALITRWNTRIAAEQTSYPESHFYDFLFNAYGALERTAPELVDEPRGDPVDNLSPAVDAAMHEMGWP